MKIRTKTLMFALCLSFLGQQAHALDWSWFTGGMQRLYAPVLRHYGKVLIGLGVVGTVVSYPFISAYIDLVKKESVLEEELNAWDKLDAERKRKVEVEIQLLNEHLGKFPKAEMSSVNAIKARADICNKRLIDLGEQSQQGRIDEAYNACINENKMLLQVQIAKLVGPEIFQKDDGLLSKAAVIKKWTEAFEGTQQLIKLFEGYSKEESQKFDGQLKDGMMSHIEQLESKAQSVGLEKESKLACWNMAGIISCLMQGAIACKTFDHMEQLWSPEYKSSFALIERFERYDKTGAFVFYKQLDAGRGLRYLQLRDELEKKGISKKGFFENLFGFHKANMSMEDMDDLYLQLVDKLMQNKEDENTELREACKRFVGQKKIVPSSDKAIVQKKESFKVEGKKTLSLWGAFQNVLKGVEDALEDKK